MPLAPLARRLPGLVSRVAGKGGEAKAGGGAPGVSAAQASRDSFEASAEGRLWDWAAARQGLRLRTLILLRWVSLAMQAVGLTYVGTALGLRPQVALAMGVVVLAGAANFALSVIWPQARPAGRGESLVQLGFDIVQLTAVLALTGGLENPFVIVLLAPVAVAAATLPSRSAALTGGLALLSVAVLATWSEPLPWRDGTTLVLPQLYRLWVLAAVTAGIVFTGLYAWQAQAEAQRMELALAATQAVLAREQRLSALGGLAAAAAHELGTPLATIQVVTKEMLRELEPGTSVHEDVALLSSQAERCRDILKKLSTSPEASDVRHDRMSLSQLMDEISEPHRHGPISVEAEVNCAVGAAILEVRRQPEVLHGLSAFVENAIDFAASIVEVTAYYDAEMLQIEVRDDGPGFPPEVMARLGEPYVTTRPQAENSRSNHLGMGLGFFIAKTLLERTGGAVEFRNARRGGAVISTRWARRRVEAPPELEF